MKKILFSTFLILVLFACSSESIPKEIQWQHDLSPSTFEQAKTEGKLILLTLEANWCHWCHVMEDSTYTNQEVRKVLNERFIAVKVDQDANPELSARYRKYGWPATIILNEKGEDILKKAGYIPPEEYVRILESALNGKGASNDALASNEDLRSKGELEKRLNKNFFSILDYRDGGFETAMKYLEEESMEYALDFVKSEKEQRWFEKSIQSSYSLCDPAWGGVYQYSARRDWNHPHFEKLLHIQARYIRLFLRDYALNGNTESLRKASEIKDYCNRFLRQKSGLYGNAQDADLIKGEKASDYFQLSDEERLKLGIPAVDTNTYTNSNADFARAMLMFHAVSGNEEDWTIYESILSHLLKRKQSNGLYEHSTQPKKIDALRDNLAMAQLLTEHIKRFPNDQRIRLELQELAKSIVKHFKMSNGSFQGFSGDLGLVPEANIEENVPLARFFNWYTAFSGKSHYKKYANSIVEFLRREDAEKSLFHEPEISMLLEEMANEASGHVSIKEGEKYPLLVQACLFAPYFSLFEVLENSSNKEKIEQFSGIEKPSLFVCTSSYCSSPLREKEAIRNFYR